MQGMHTQTRAILRKGTKSRVAGSGNNYHRLQLIITQKVSFNSYH